MAENKIKSIFFLFIFFVFITFIFLLLQNLEAISLFVSENFFLVLFVLVVLFLILRYDYVLQLRDYERAVIFTLGKVNRVGGPGWALVFPPLESYTRVDLRTHAIDIEKQDVVTKDNIEVTIDAVIYLKVDKKNEAVINSVVEVDDYVRASKLYVIGLIRDKAGSLELNELISQIEDLNSSLKFDLEKISKKWGVIVEEAAIKDVQIPRTVLDAMHEQKAAVQRKLARMEGAAAHRAEIEAVKEATELLNDRALAYYYVKALEKLGEGKSSKFIFPMELTKLADSLTKKNLSDDEIQQLLKKYAPVVKSLVKEK